MKYEIYSYHIADESIDPDSNYYHSSANSDDSAYDAVQSAAIGLSSDEQVYAVRVSDISKCSGKTLFNTYGYREC